MQVGRRHATLLFTSFRPLHSTTRLSARSTMAQLLAAHQAAVARRPYVVVLGTSHARDIGRCAQQIPAGAYHHGFGCDAEVRELFIRGGSVNQVHGLIDSIRHQDHGYLPNVVVLMAGSNDSRNYDSRNMSSQIVGLAEAIIRFCNRDHPAVRTQVVVLGLLPRAESVPALGNRTPHPNYNRWAAAVNKQLHRLLNPARLANEADFNGGRLVFRRQPTHLYLGAAKRTYPDRGHLHGQELLKGDGVHLRPIGQELVVIFLTQTVHNAVVRSWWLPVEYLW